MRTRSLLFIVTLAATVWAAYPAVALGWSPPVAGAVALGYGVGCPTGTHRGIDVAATGAETVHAPLAGTVRFAGQVPADGGGTCGAVTLELGDGRLLSLMPLAEVFVSEGYRLGEGEALGVLAGSGDASISAPHLHVGLREGGVYRDPAALITAPATGEAHPAGAPCTSTVAQGSASGGVALTIGDVAPAGPAPAMAVRPVTATGPIVVGAPSVTPAEAVRVRTFTQPAFARLGRVASSGVRDVGTRAAAVTGGGISALRLVHSPGTLPALAGAACLALGLVGARRLAAARG